MSKDFNGTTDLVSLGSPAALDDIGGSPGSKTVAAWIFADGWGEGNFGRIWDKGTFASTGWFFYLTNFTTANENDLAAFKMSIGGATAGKAAAIANTLTLSKWWFIAGTYTPGDGGPRLWVGDAATPVAEVTYKTGARADVATYASDAAQTAYIGNRADAARTFDGRIGHLSVWDQALSAAQLDQLRIFPYAAVHRFSVGGTGANLAGYWPFWESATATALDHSGNGNNGTVTGTSLGAEPPFTFTRRGLVHAVRTVASGVSAVTIAAVAVGVAAVTKKTNKTLAAVATGVVSLVKKTSKALEAVAVGSAALLASVFHGVTLAASGVGVATLSVARRFSQTIAATAVGVAGMVVDFLGQAATGIANYVISYRRRRRG